MCYLIKISIYDILLLKFQYPAKDIHFILLNNFFFMFFLKHQSAFSLLDILSNKLSIQEFYNANGIDLYVNICQKSLYLT